MTHHTGYHTVVNSEFAVTDERVPVPVSCLFSSREKEGRKEGKRQSEKHRN